jgi:hypothetical protein
MKISLKDAVKMIKGTNGEIFSCRFIKRSDNSIRDMVCRLRVKKHLNGNGPVYNAADYNLIHVFDMDKVKEIGDGPRSYRSINLDTIQKITVAGQTYEVLDASQNS